MREIYALLREAPQARPFFAALAQSSLGTGAGYVGLVIIALDRFDSPWAISLVLLADLGPAMLLGPLFGAIADRFSRRTCMVIADLIRAAAFCGIAFASSFELTLVLAAVAGIGTGLFTPAALASLPSLVEPPRLPAASAVYGVLADLGYTIGPALAAGALLLGSAESLMVANAITFAVSAVVLARLSFGGLPAGEREPFVEARPSLLAEARDGLRATVGMIGLRTVLFASGVALFFGGLFNVGELLLVTRELGTTETAYSALVALYGLGFVAGSISGSKGGELSLLKRRYLIGVAVMGIGFVGAGLSPTLPLALGAFAVAGVGNGLLLVYERLMIQALVPDQLSGRVFGVKDALTAWAFGLAFVSAGGLIELVGVRELLVFAGTGALLVWAISAIILRRAWTALAGDARVETVVDVLSGSGRNADTAGSRRAREHGSYPFGGGGGWLALLDDLD